MKLLEDGGGGGAFPRRRNYLSTAKPLRWNARETLHPPSTATTAGTKRKETDEREGQKQKRGERE